MWPRLRWRFHWACLSSNSSSCAHQVCTAFYMLTKTKTHEWISMPSRSFVLTFWPEPKCSGLVKDCPEGPGLWWFALKCFDFTNVQKRYVFSRNWTLNFDLFLAQQHAVWYAPDLGSGSEVVLPSALSTLKVGGAKLWCLVG